MKKLDKKDRQILKSLQKDGRISNADLAKTIHLSPTPCLDRVRRLEKDGYIEGYRAVLSPTLLEQDFVAFVTVSLDRVTTDVLDAFSRHAKRIPEIVECHMVGGGFDFLLKIRAADMPAFRQLLGEKLSALPQVAQTSTYFVMEQILSTRDLTVET